mmetsp:Transcript_122500/g.357697  ORF Transcript_122500/g.357697 Transcript_122500/m.357697 type:complete len:300 (-) Transcript_122500:286-1185(-)
MAVHESNLRHVPVLALKLQDPTTVVCQAQLLHTVFAPTLTDLHHLPMDQQIALVRVAAIWIHADVGPVTHLATWHRGLGLRYLGGGSRCHGGNLACWPHRGLRRAGSCRAWGLGVSCGLRRKNWPRVRNLADWRARRSLRSKRWWCERCLAAWVCHGLRQGSGCCQRGEAGWAHRRLRRWRGCCEWSLAGWAFHELRRRTGCGKRSLAGWASHTLKGCLTGRARNSPRCSGILHWTGYQVVRSLVVEAWVRLPKDTAHLRGTNWRWEGRCLGAASCHGLCLGGAGHWQRCFAAKSERNR